MSVAAPAQLWVSDRLLDVPYLDFVTAQAADLWRTWFPVTQCDTGPARLAALWRTLCAAEGGGLRQTLLAAGFVVC